MSNSFDHYSRKAKGAINRFYSQADTRTLNQLQELVSDLALAESSEATDKLWAKASVLLAKTQLAPAEVQRATATKNTADLARVVSKALKAG